MVVTMTIFGGDSSLQQTIGCESSSKTRRVVVTRCTSRETIIMETIGELDGLRDSCGERT